MMVGRIFCVVLLAILSTVLTVDALECVACQKQGDQITGDCNTKTKCHSDLGYNKCMNMSFTMKMNMLGTDTVMTTWQSGCGNDNQCQMSSEDMCAMNKRVMSQSGMDVELSDCKIECTDGGGSPSVGGGGSSSGGGSSGGSKVACPTCVKAGPTSTPCVDSECPAGVTQCLKIEWEMGFMGMKYPSWQKMCAMPMQCTMSGKDVCKSSEQFLNNLGLTNITLSDCKTSCTPGTPVEGGGDGDGDVGTVVPDTDSSNGGSGLQCDTCTLMPGQPSNCVKKSCPMGADRCMVLSYDLVMGGNTFSATQKSCASDVGQCQMPGSQMCQIIQQNMPKEAGMTVSNCQIECTGGSGTDGGATVKPGVDGGDKDGTGDKDGAVKPTTVGKTVTDSGDKPSSGGEDKTTDSGDKDGDDKPKPTSGGGDDTDDGDNDVDKDGNDGDKEGSKEDNKVPDVKDKTDEKKPIGTDKTTGDGTENGDSQTVNSISLMGSVVLFSLFSLFN